MPKSAPLDGLDLNLLVSLQAILQEGSVSRAAEELGRTQPTLSRALASLRTTFGDPLLVRAGRGMALTPFAQALRAPLEQSLSALERLRSIGEFDPSRDQRRFRLLVPDVIGVRIVPALFERMTNAPGITIDVLGDERDALRKLLHDEVDLCIHAAAIEHAELYSRRVGRLPWCVVYGPHHASWARSMSYEDWLSSEHLQLVPAGKPRHESPLDDLLATQGETRSIRVHISYLPGVAELLETKNWVTTLPKPIATWLVHGRELRAEPHPLTLLEPLRLRTTWHAIHQIDAGHQWLRKLVHECIDGL